ncbi:MAG: YafY family transcriptional regulator [Chloroflexi bacterium]|nr:MAG: YafY family transcriptional regulator [Chloroflexota bacterium]
MGTSARLLRLLSLLQTPRDWTGAELAARLEVSARTIRNDIERLRALGYPVHATRGSVGGYRLEAGASMPPLLLEDDEAVAVAIGLRTATSGTVTGLEETSLRALAKLEQVLPPRLRRQVGTLQRMTLSVARRRSNAPTVDPARLTELALLCREHFGLWFDYSDRRETASKRRVEPYRIVNAGQRWYLVAWDLDRADWRTFRVDRMKPGMSPGPRFTPRELTDDEVEALISRGVPPEARRHQARILVQCPARELADRVGPWVGTITAIDDSSCLLETGADNLEMLAVYLGLLGADFSVSDPPELVEQLRVLARRYAVATV